MKARAAPASAAEGGLAERVRAGERAAVARAISTVEAGGEKSAALLEALHGAVGRARLIGVTGAPGVGKSTLVGALIVELRRRGRSVAVVAVDPSSPVSGGAILGDRVRMNLHGEDDGVFIRSLASRGGTGGLSLATSRVADVLDAAGFDDVIIETVGAGQSEIHVADVADLTVVVCAPGLGDEVQAMKAGLLEVADVLVVNKADDPLAAVTANQLQSMLELRREAHRAVPVLKTAATRSEGMAALADALDEAFRQPERKTRRERRFERMRRLLAATAGGMLARRLESARGPLIEDLSRRAAAGEVDLESAAAALLKSDAWRDD